MELIEVEFLKDNRLYPKGEVRAVDEGSARALIERGDARATGRRTIEPDTPLPGWHSVDLTYEGGGRFGAASWRTDATWIRVGDVHIPDCVEVSMPGANTQPSLSLTIQVRQGVPCFTRVEVISKADGQPVIGQHLLTARGQLHYWLDTIVELVASEVDPDPTREPDWADRQAAKNSLKVARKQRRNGRQRSSARRDITPEFLSDVARIYRAHIDTNPLEQIRLVYPASPRTVARWVELCRSDKYQLLPKTKQGQRKA